MYCDRLSLLSALHSVRLRRRAAADRWRLRVLDPLPRGWQLLVLRTAFRLFRIDVEEASFFAGRLVTPEGGIAQVAAARASGELSFPAAERIVGRLPILHRLNESWGRNTILLHLARSVSISVADANSIYQYMLRLQVARALAHTQDSTPHMSLRCPVSFEPDVVRGAVPDLTLSFYGRISALLIAKYLMGRRLLKYFLVGPMMSWWCRRRAESLPPSIRDGKPTIPGLLIIQEADLTLDRSYRTQPHWLFSKEGWPRFHTYVFPNSPPQRAPHDAAALATAAVIPLDTRAVAALSSEAGHEALERRLRRDATRTVLAALVSRSAADTVALASVAGLLAQARSLAAVCRRLNIRAFMTSENYLLPAEAMQLIAAPLDIHTLSYQYSNLAHGGPGLMTTADTMLSSSPMYHRHWIRDGIRPGRFVDVGYAYDSSFPLVRERARTSRQRLTEAGARFVLCYFDETVEHHKYGLIDAEAQRDDIFALLALLRDDPSVALVTKTQYLRNSPSRVAGLAADIAAAKRTGRCLEFLHGVHRNTVLPAEAALVADITIGHAVGGTASLEAALAGVRSIVLNPYGKLDGNSSLYAQADIVFPSMGAALEAIREYRAGVPSRRGLGDWAPILQHFDPYRDGRAGYRIREILEQAVLRDDPVRSGPDRGDALTIDGLTLRANGVEAAEPPRKRA